MKKFFTKKNDGFTLIELMVVVAIIGILSAIAVPNFKKYQAKSKQSEAKIQLAAVYTTEVGALSDYDSYATCLTDLGYELNPKGYYVVGFTTAEVTNVAARITCASAPNLVPTVALKSGGAAAGASNLPSNALTATTFRAGAAGNISAGLYDTWTINEAKEFVNVPGY